MASCCKETRYRRFLFLKNSVSLWGYFTQKTGSAFLKITFKYSILNITRYIVTLERYTFAFARYSHILRCVVILCNIKSPNHWCYVINYINLKYTVVLKIIHTLVKYDQRRL